MCYRLCKRVLLNFRHGKHIARKNDKIITMLHQIFEHGCLFKYLFLWVHVWVLYLHTPVYNLRNISEMFFVFDWSFAAASFYFYFCNRYQCSLNSRRNKDLFGLLIELVSMASIIVWSGQNPICFVYCGI